MQLLYFLIAAATATIVYAQYPDGCACPEECDCIARSAIIDCSSRGLSYVPREINSCAWPGITTVYVSQPCVCYLMSPTPFSPEAHAN